MISREQLQKAAAEPEKFKLLEKVPFDFKPVSAAGQQFEKVVLNSMEVPEKRIRKLVILDTETTGVDNTAELIELAFCVCSYDVRTRTVLSIWSTLLIPKTSAIFANQIMALPHSSTVLPIRTISPRS